MDKRGSIIAAACEAFSENGFAKSRVQDIARSADVGKGTIYEYFKSKEILLLACCTSFCDEMCEGVSKNIVNAADATPHPAVALYHLMCQSIDAILGSDQKKFRLFILLWTVVDTESEAAQEIRVAIQEMYNTFEGECNELYALGVQQGVLRSWTYKNMPGRILAGVIDGWLWQRSFRTAPLFDSQSLAHDFAYSFLEQNVIQPEILEQLQ